MHCAELGPSVVITVSIGVAEYRPGESITQAVGRADEALYLAKSAGRNRVACHGDAAQLAVMPPLATVHGGHEPVDASASLARLLGCLPRRLAHRPPQPPHPARPAAARHAARPPQHPAAGRDALQYQQIQGNQRGLRRRGRRRHPGAHGPRLVAPQPVQVRQP
jgi:hypothetical protein